MTGDHKIAERLRAARERAGYENAVDAPRAFGWNESTYLGHENGSRGIGRAAKKYATAFRVQLGWLLNNEGRTGDDHLPHGVTRGPSPGHKTTRGRSKASSPQLALELQFSIPEIDAQIGAGGGSLAEIMTVKDGQASIAEEDDIRIANAEDIRGFWQIPADYLTRELRVNPRRAFVVEVEGDSMSPTLESGDRVVINIGQQQPSPPGIFALWNGISVVIKRVEFIPNTEPPKLKISSDNPRHETYERTIEEVQIVGRARLRVGRL